MPVVTSVTSVEQLLSAIDDDRLDAILVSGAIEQVPALRLPPGKNLRGTDERTELVFAGDGLQLTRDNSVASLRLRAAPTARALFNDTTLGSLGTLTLKDVTTWGTVEILARDALRSGHIVVDGLDVVAADARERTPRPHGYGVDVLQGAFTLWNQHDDPSVGLSARLSGISAGRDGAPVRGSGIFVSGGGDDGGRLEVSHLQTGEVFSDGGIAEGTRDQIAGGVFVVYGAHVNAVRNSGRVTTYGVNDTVLGTWGTVKRWVAEAPISSYGPSGIGFVNFGAIGRVEINAPIETFGLGARGFNVYDGTVGHAEFDRIVTHADGAVGVQVSRPFERLIVHRGIETHGGEGDSLVKGVITKLAANALSMKPGSRAANIRIDGGLVAHRDGVSALDIRGDVGELTISGGVGSAPGKP